MSAPTPVDLTLGPIVAERFPALQAGLVEARLDPRDREAFVLDRGVVELLRELRPDDGVGAAVEELVTFVHAAFLHWVDGESVVEADRAAIDRVVRAVRPGSPPDSTPGPIHLSYYLQFAPRRIWGEPLTDAPPEPLDGCFVRIQDGEADALAVFGLHPNRPGFTAVRAVGPRPADAARSDGSEAFAPTVEGGQAAGLVSLAGTDELLELLFRVHDLLGAAGLRPGRQRLPL